MICADYTTDCLLGIIKICLIFNPWSAGVTNHSRYCCGLTVRSIFISFFIFTPQHRRNRKSCISCLLNIARWFKNFICFNLFQGFLLQKNWPGSACRILCCTPSKARLLFYYWTLREGVLLTSVFPCWLFSYGYFFGSEVLT